MIIYAILKILILIIYTFSNTHINAIIYVYIDSFLCKTAQLESLALKKSDSKLDPNKDDCALDYFAFGNNSPKRNNQDDLDKAAHSRDVDDWLLTDKWDKSRYPSVPDSEAATAIESILNEELS